ncbi:helix-turn-helix domain-containing protein [Dactylosporangium sp. NPDC050688]|uniref:helix-turn-helix domain-containing protein n=1 Tax=Dactylosporangium sp. NPDC050688 TaxID=3157217 RepID=UPI0033CC79A2
MEQPASSSQSRPDDNRFGSLLRRLRGAAGLTQEELAAAADLGVRTLRDLELGVSVRPQRRTVERLAIALRVTPAEREALIERARTARIVGSGTDRGATGDGAAPGHSLPRDPAGFVGRAEELGMLLDGGPHGGVTVVGGPPGAGKTTVVIHAAHLLTAEHATVVYAELADADGTATAPQDVLGHLLTALGVESGRIPATHGGRLAAYQRLASGRRGVLVLDNPQSEQQVRPLLPAGTGWRVLVAARRRLAGLPATHRIVLDALPEDEALRLLATAVGADRTAREPAAAAELVELCGRLPLALRVVANRLSSRPAWTLQSLAERLRDPRRRLDRLSVGDLEVRGAIAASYRQLPPAARSAVRRMALLPEPSCDDATLHALAGPGAGPAATGALHDSGLLLPADAPGRHRLHPLIALYCAEQATEDDTTAVEGFTGPP